MTITPEDNRNHPMKIAVLGTGYVGLTTAVALAHLGHQITGIDIDAERVDVLNQGHCPIVENQMPEYLAAGLEQQRLHFTTNVEEAATAELVFVCVPTPASASGHPDMSAIEMACTQLKPVVAAGAVVVCKSTVPVGTNQRIRDWLARPDVTVASNPEFLREGTALSDFLEPDRVVIGVESAREAEPLVQLFSAITDNIHVVETAEAELIKYAANAFLATKLSFVNEIARLADATGAKADAVLTALGSDARISPQFLTPGPGWGGSCFPKDTLALRQLAEDRDVEAPVITAAIESNRAQTSYIANAVERLVGHRPTTIGVWGLTFKAGTDDMRDSPAVTILDELVRRGHQITVYDPAAASTPFGVRRAVTPEAAAVGAELLVVLTEWQEFETLDLNPVREAMKVPHVFDTRGVLDAAAVAAADLRLLNAGPELLTA